ncbi:MAG TPA: phosphotransferase family protein [Candidatus Sulfotelmatobacter sp.]|nr:phosphotransferase family protein [Candidatus Sulfotelmatobacter sp.]
MSEREEFAGRLQRAVARLIGPPGTIGELRRLTGGATKSTWAFTADVGGRNLPLVMQLSSRRATAAGEPLAELPRVTGKDDAALMQAAARAGVPTPPIRAVLTDQFERGGYIMDFVPGETIARRLLREPAHAPLRADFAAQCGAILGRIHAIDRAAAPFLVPFGAAAQVDLYRRVFQSYDHPVPALDLGFRWAADHVPAARRMSVVHGDFRMGNLICGPERIAAAIDWEVSHLGDPMEDLGWLCVKTWRFGGKSPVGGIGRREDLFAAYERATGIAVVPADVRFWEVFGSVKWAVMCLMKGQAHHRDGGERSVEQHAIGRRMEEPIHDFLQLLAGED